MFRVCPLNDPLGQSSRVRRPAPGRHGPGESGVLRNLERAEAGDPFRHAPAPPRGGRPLTRAATEAGVPLRTAQRWLARYRQNGSTGLARLIRRDGGRRRSPSELVALIEGMG
jgi:hypothetical protein